MKRFLFLVLFGVIPASYAIQYTQNDVIGRVAAGSGPVTGLQASEVTTEASPASGDFVWGWIAEGDLRKYDIGSFVLASQINSAATLETTANLGAYFSDFAAATSEANFKSITNLEAGTDYSGYSVIWFAVGDESTEITAAANKFKKVLPRAFVIDTTLDSGVGCSVSGAPTGSGAVFDINDDGTTIFTTNKCSIDVGETNSQDAGTAPNVTTTTIAKGSVLSVDFDSVGSTYGGDGPAVWLIGRWQ